MRWRFQSFSLPQAAETRRAVSLLKDCFELPELHIASIFPFFLVKFQVQMSQTGFVMVLKSLNQSNIVFNSLLTFVNQIKHPVM